MLLRKNGTYLTFLVTYLVVCGLWGEHSYSPMFIRKWKLFDTWTPENYSFNDIKFKLNDDASGPYYSALKNAPMLQRYNIDTVAMTNLLTKHFDHYNYSFDQQLTKFKHRCPCHDFKLIKIESSLNAYVLETKPSTETFIRNL